MKNEIVNTIKLVETRIQDLIKKLDTCSEKEISNIHNQLKKAVNYKNQLDIELNQN